MLAHTRNKLVHENIVESLVTLVDKARNLFDECGNLKLNIDGVFIRRGGVGMVIRNGKGEVICQLEKQRRNLHQMAVSLIKSRGVSLGFRRFLSLINKNIKELIRHQKSPTMGSSNPSLKRRSNRVRQGRTYVHANMGYSLGDLM
ncbi:unnamed protein product [Prunus armeniaca]